MRNLLELTFRVMVYPTLSSPLSSSTIVNPSSQSDNFRIEESETHHNSKGDLAEWYNNIRIETEVVFDCDLKTSRIGFELFTT